MSKLIRETFFGVINARPRSVRRAVNIGPRPGGARTATAAQGAPESTADDARAQRERAEADAYDADVEAAAVAAEGEAS
jgi:hypothetical protein